MVPYPQPQCTGADYEISLQPWSCHLGCTALCAIARSFASLRIFACRLPFTESRPQDRSILCLHVARFAAVDAVEQAVKAHANVVLSQAPCAEAIALAAILGPLALHADVRLSHELEFKFAVSGTHAACGTDDLLP